MSVKTTVHLREDLHAEVARLVGPRGLSHFVNDAIEAHLTELRRQQLERDLIAGYRARTDEPDELEPEWEVVATEGWPE
jgi:Arc/MetJ family transcription regulator